MAIRLSKSCNYNSLLVVGLIILCKFSRNFFYSLIISSRVKLPYYVSAIFGVYYDNLFDVLETFILI